MSIAKVKYSGHRWSVGEAPEEGAPMGANARSGDLRGPQDEVLMSLSFGWGGFAGGVARAASAFRAASRSPLLAKCE